MSIKQRLLLLALIPTLAILTVAGLGWQSLARINAEQTRLADELKPLIEEDFVQLGQFTKAIELLLNADRDGYQAILAEADALKTNDPDTLQQALDTARENRDQVRERATQAIDAFDQQSIETLDQAIAAFEIWSAQSEQLFEARSNGQTPQQLADLRVASRTSFQAFRDQLDQAVGVLETKLEANRHHIAEAKAVALSSTLSIRGLSSQAITWFAITAAAASVIVITLGFFTARSITSPIQKLVAEFRDIANGKGDLTRKIKDSRNDEIGQLSQAFNRFIETMRSTLIDARACIEGFDQTAQEIESRSEQTTRDSRDQSTKAAQVAAAVEEFAASVSEVADKTGQAARASQSASSTASQGGEVVGQTITGMRAIASAVESAGTVIAKLGQRGQEIGELVEVINDIADQTNLLALNAAIEAARAGEHGRGFAVVADEVRKLADRTTKATEEIAKSIEGIQIETQQAVESMNEGTASVEAGVDQASEAGTSLQKIVAGTDDLSNMIQSISATIEQQAGVTETMAKDIAEIGQISEQTAGSFEAMAATVSGLTQQSATARQTIARFKLD
ncbi:methyl-accepting chemotaxis protein [Mucisphaera sp.]|uniref:methyl-accepting chemotaxis protein n=1 Tax=Mucisphaera sp. TaxID=2913024 RepID=UPI003D1360A3